MQDGATELKQSASGTRAIACAYTWLGTIVAAVSEVIGLSVVAVAIWSWRQIASLSFTPMSDPCACDVLTARDIDNV